MKFSSLLSSASKDVKMASTLCSIAKNRIVASVHWSSSKSLTLGLRGGDTVLVSLLEESRGSSLPLVEFLFRDTFLLQVLWNGIMQTDNLEKATLGTFTLEMRAGLGLTERNASNRDDIVMAVSSEGVLRIWNTGSKRCTVQASLAQLLNNMLAVEVLEGITGDHRLVRILLIQNLANRGNVSFILCYPTLIRKHECYHYRCGNQGNCVSVCGSVADSHCSELQKSWRRREGMACKNNFV